MITRRAGGVGGVAHLIVIAACNLNSSPLLQGFMYRLPASGIAALSFQLRYVSSNGPSRSAMTQSIGNARPAGQSDRPAASSSSSSSASPPSGPPPTRTYSFVDSSNAVAMALQRARDMKDAEMKEQERIQAGKVKHDVSPRPYRLDVLSPIRLVCVPDTSGVHRKETREHVATALRPVLGEIIGHRYVGTGDGTAIEKDLIVVTGDVRPAYLSRILGEGDRRHVVYVGKDVVELSTAAAAVMEAVGETGPSRLTLIRGYLPFLLSHVFAEESLSTVVVSNPPLMPHPRQSHQRLVVRDTYMLAHRALRVRSGPNDPTGGFVSWTSNPEQFEFMLEQLEESRQVCPYAKKAPSIFEGLLPLEGTGEIRSSGSRFVCATKSAATPANVKLLIEAHTFQRRVYKALFPTNP